MPIFPVRDLAKYGAITDIDAYNLPIGAWSTAVNVRFHAGRISRAPIFRTAKTTLTNASPRLVSSMSPSGGFDTTIIGSLNGNVTQYASGAETSITPAGWTASNAEFPYTACHLANVYYINRADHVPWVMRLADATLQPLNTLGNWPANYFANIVRSCGSALIAFGINKGGIYYPTMVKTSEFTQSNTTPPNWDPTITGTNATENILGDMEGAISDARNLGEIMIVYGLNETWTMRADGSTNVWDYQRIFSDAGAINANCSVEVDRKHFVFGLNDLWMHDGTEKKSIADQRVRRFVFDNLNLTYANRCFVAHNQALKEIYFCYRSTDAYCAFASSVNDGANRAAVYNYANDTWTFYDLPFVYSGWQANVSTSDLTYTNIATTYASDTNTYIGLDDANTKVFVFVGDNNANYVLNRSLYAFDLEGSGARTTLTVDTRATAGWQLIRDGIDLDEVGVDLRGYKLLTSIYPQMRLEAGAVAVSFNVGTADYFNQPINWATAETYDGNTLYKLDYNVTGRYLALKVSQIDYHWFVFTGFDTDLDVLGER